LAADYPNFDGWITRTLGDDRTSVSIGLHLARTYLGRA